jgi:hypothetical protein
MTATTDTGGPPRASHLDEQISGGAGRALRLTASSRVLIRNVPAGGFWSGECQITVE